MSTPNKLKRWNYFIGYDDVDEPYIESEENTDGDWVRYEDVQSVIDDRDRWRKLCQQLQNEADQLYEKQK